MLYSQFSGVNTIQYKLLLDIDTTIPQNHFSTLLRGSFVLVGASKELRTLNLRQHANEIISSFWAELGKEYLPDESKWAELTGQADFLRKFA